MPSGYQISSVWSGLERRSSRACLKYQMFQPKVDSSNAQVAVPGIRLPRNEATGHVRMSVKTTKTPRTIQDGRVRDRAGRGSTGLVMR